MIKVTDLSKSFRNYKKPVDRLVEAITGRLRHTEHPVLRSISFQLSSGETLAILGKNGAGKSTLLKVLTGVLRPDQGYFEINGKVTALLELGTGFNPELTGQENIFSNAAYLGISQQKVAERLPSIIEFAEIGEAINEPLKSYSSGMVMRLAFAIAIHSEPSCFIIDEALSVGDAYFQQKCFQYLRDFKEQGGSILFVSHDIHAIKALCDRAILLEKGEVFAEGSPDQVVNAYYKLISGDEDRYKLRDQLEGYGSAEVNIEKVTLRSAGQECKSITSGQSVEFVVSLKVAKPIGDVTVGILIRDRFGQDIYGINTHNRESITLNQEGFAHLIYSQDMNLGEGRYLVTIAVHKGENHTEHCIQWRDNLLEFEVTRDPSYPFVGVARLTSTVSFYQGEVSE